MIKSFLKNWFCFILLFQFFECAEFSTGQNSNNLIEEETMEKILFDAIMMEVMSTFSEKNPDFIRLLGPSYLYQKYEIDSVKLIKSEEYYSKNPRIYYRVYNKVLKQLQIQKDSIDKLSKPK